MHKLILTRGEIYFLFFSVLEVLMEKLYESASSN